MPLPLLVALRVCPPTVTEIVASVSFTVPVSAGVRSLVVRVFTVTMGTELSTVTSLSDGSLLLLPAGSVAVASTLKVPLARGASVPAGSVQVPLPLLVALKVWPEIVTLIVAVLSLVKPEMAGLVRLVSRVLTLTVGAVLSTEKLVGALAPAKVLPEASETPVPMEIPNVPSPLGFDGVTVTL